MADRRDLDDWVLDALRCLGGRARPIEVARFIWRQHQTQLRASGDLFYTWQQEMHLSASRLRRLRVIKSPRRGLWEVDREALLARAPEATPPQSLPLGLVREEPEDPPIPATDLDDDSSVA